MDEPLFASGSTALIAMPRRVDQQRSIPAVSPSDAKSRADGGEQDLNLERTAATEGHQYGCNNTNDSHILVLFAFLRLGAARVGVGTSR